MPNIDSTFAISLLVHGEAVRLNRGKSQNDDFDFKYLKDRQGRVYPYVSSQCFKKYWREALPTPFSPVTRGKNSAGKEKNQVFTEGNPIEYLDDDLFGYMRAGADSEVSEQSEAEDGEASPELDDDYIESLMFVSDDVLKPVVLLAKFKAKLSAEDKTKRTLEEKTGDGSTSQSDKTGFYSSLISAIPEEPRQNFNTADKGDCPPDVLEALIAVMNQAIRNPTTSGHTLSPGQRKEVNGGTLHSDIVRRQFLADFKEALTEKAPTTKRTSPIRMHALVAFSGIKMAKDFQTFARDTSLTDKPAVLNPNPVGIYSGWLKTRILIEGKRIGKFYLGKNREIMPKLLEDMGADAPITLNAPNPYSHKPEDVAYVQLDAVQRAERAKMALHALADIGNRQGPASGALHDGSLRPKGFIGAFMVCADSPFDAVWQGGEEAPHLDLRRLRSVILDWEDLFASKKIYVGFPVEMNLDATTLQESLDVGKDMEEVRALGFTFSVQTPRKALLEMAGDVDA